MSLRDELNKIYQQRGELSPKIVVEVARKKDHPLHDIVFDVPPGQAAERYYLNRAHELIQSVKIAYRDPQSDKKIDVRAWHAIARGNSHVYRPTDEVLEDPLLREMVLANMQREWVDLHRRYSQFKEFLEMVARDIGKAA